MFSGGSTVQKLFNRNGSWSWIGAQNPAGYRIDVGTRYRRGPQQVEGRCDPRIERGEISYLPRVGLHSYVSRSALDVLVITHFLLPMVRRVVGIDQSRICQNCIPEKQPVELEMLATSLAEWEPVGPPRLVCDYLHNSCVYFKTNAVDLAYIY